jgi:hypothetical protein
MPAGACQCLVLVSLKPGIGAACAPQPLILFLQYNYIAARLSLSFPEWLDNIAGAVQLLFSSGSGVFSLDCLLKDGSKAPLQRALIDVAIPFAVLLVTLVFWMLRYAFPHTLFFLAVSCLPGRCRT